MASKEKILDSAQKFIAKGQLAKAVGEYQKLVDAFPNDFRYRQKIAELLTRDRRNEEAQPHYEAVAKNFNETGFYLKAIAIYKQMQKVEPDRADLYLRLAELNEKQGLVGNALSEYRSLIAHYEKKKQVKEALPVLQKMVALDPENLGVRGKLIETLVACYEDEAASDQFRALVAFLEEKGEAGKIVRLYEKFQDQCAAAKEDQLPLAVALVASEQAGKALPILKELLKSDPENAETLQGLIDCHMALGNHEDARLACQHLLKRYPDNLLLRERQVRICLAAGDKARALELLEELRGTFLREGQQLLFRELYSAAGGAEPEMPVTEPEILPEDPPAAPTPRLSSPRKTASVEPTRKPEPLSGGLELELDLDLDLPGTTAAPAIAAEPEPDVASQEDPAAKVSIPLPEVGELDLDLDLDGFDLDAVPLPEAGDMPVSVESEQELEPEPAGEPDPLPAEFSPSEASGLELDLDLGLPAGFGGAAAPQPVGSADEAIVAAAAPGDIEAKKPGTEPADELILPDLDAVEPALPPETPLEMGSVDVSEHSPADEPAREDLQEALPPATVRTPSDDAEVKIAGRDFDEPEVLEELEEVLEELDELEELEELVELEEVEELAEELASVSEPPVDADTSPDITDKVAEKRVPAAESLREEDSPVDSQVMLLEGLEDAEFYLRQGLLDDAERVLSDLEGKFSGHQLLSDKLEELTALRQIPAATDDSSVLFDGFADIEEDELLGGVDAAEAAEPAVDEFSMESPVVEMEGEEDLQSHFDLGIAYKEMGLLDDAIAEFDRASKDPARRLDCLTLKGQCQLDMGQPVNAESTYRQALDIPMLSDEGRLVLCYELGLLYENLGRKQEALDNYQIVANIDLFFRDVTDKLKVLREELGVDDQAIEAVSEGGSGRDRISFV